MQKKILLLTFSLYTITAFPNSKQIMSAHRVADERPQIIIPAHIPNIPPRVRAPETNQSTRQTFLQRFDNFVSNRDPLANVPLISLAALTGIGMIIVPLLDPHYLNDDQETYTAFLSDSSKIICFGTGIAISKISRRMYEITCAKITEENSH